MVNQKRFRLFCIIRRILSETKFGLVPVLMLIMALAMSTNPMADTRHIDGFVAAPGAFAGPRNCLNFDGSDDAVQLVNSSSFRSVTGALTIESWIKADSIDHEDAVFMANERYSLQLTGSGSIRTGIRIDGSWSEHIHGVHNNRGMASCGFDL